ncbi:MAG TPA: fumarylacetoacetate hydrolase family protein [Burkholderiales bacterium]|nr:fumarylacetoacetate hydrolase family protein [Burkholderiales bacterium]
MSVPFSLCTVESGGRPIACIEREGRYFRLPSDLMTLLAQGAPLDTLTASEEVKADRVLTPLQYPGKVLCAGANYYDHLKEMGVPDLRKEAQRLFFFFKPPRNALVGPGRTVRYPADSRMFDWEVELAAVIGRRSRRLTMANALDAVAAYTIGIDLSARDLNRAPETFYKLDWVAGKAQDTGCPLGPRLVPAKFIRDPQDLALKLSVNGEVKQDARTSGMIFDLREQLVTLSAIMTLDPGDVVLTGTPAGVGFPKQTFLKPGDRIDAEIESIGRLSVEIGEPA